MPVKGHIPKAVVDACKKGFCEHCKISAEEALVRDKNALGLHHKDMDRTNNAPHNLITLCTVCHTKEHWLRGSKRGYKKAYKCKVCVEMAELAVRLDYHKPPIGVAVKLGLCETHRTRMRRHGSPYLYKVKVGKKWMTVDERKRRPRQKASA